MYGMHLGVCQNRLSQHATPRMLRQLLLQLKIMPDSRSKNQTQSFKNLLIGYLAEAVWQGRIEEEDAFTNPALNKKKFRSASPKTLAVEISCLDQHPPSSINDEY